MKKSFSKIINLRAQHAIFFSFLIAGVAAEAAPLSEARVSQLIQDVRLLSTNAAPRPAAINDKVEQGTAVRTGTQSRAELTFTDLTITRLGENTIFSLNAAAREIDITHGSVLLQVPANSAPAKISTAAVTAAITGGTALFGTGPPVKFMVLEGVGTFYPAGHPELAVTIHGGEMVTLTADGHITAPQTFDVKTVVETSALIVGFPDLANLPLILQVMDQQQVDQSTASSSPPPSKDIIDTTSQNTVANPALSPPPPPSSSPPSEFGPPPTISSPDPYLITSGTTITTDPTITTNGVTNQGTLYRGTALDGSPTAFLFGEAPTVFDQLVFNGSQKNLPVAVFKFANLELTGDPTVTVPSGATTNLALVAVGSITSGGPGGTLTFAGITHLDFITQNGSINLGSEISFSGIDHLMFYARGSGSNLTLASPISGGSVVHLFSEGTVQVNGNITVTDQFKSISGGDFLAGSGVVTATNIDIASINGNVNIDGSQFANPPDNTGSVVLNAANTLNLVLDNRPAGFGWASFDAQATTINITGNNTFDFSNASGGVTFAAGTGGINAPNIDFVGSPPGGLSFLSGGSINIGSINSEDATISAATSFTASGNITGAFIGSTLTAGTTVDVGGNLFVLTLTAGGNINVGNDFIALNVNAPSSILTVQNAIVPFGGPGSLQYTFNVDSIVTPRIDFSFNGTPNFVGNLTINANTLTFDSATGIGLVNFNGVNANEFGSGNPAEGGNGGVFIVNSAGDITANSGADIMATTGLNTAPGVYSGAGGTVKLISTGGMVTVNDTIQVSSDDSEAPRQSASGGTILLQSDLTTGTGITVGANGQLLSLLNLNALNAGGTPGSITLSTMGADIIVNGTVRADFGTVTLDQNDPAGSTPTITIDGATVQAATFNINGSGDLTIGPNNATAINIFGGTWNVAHDITLNAANTSFAYSFALNATAGDAINFTGGSSGAPATLTLPLSGDSTFTAGTGGINAQFVDIHYAGAALNLISAGDITANSITFTDGFSRGNVNAAGAISTTNNLWEGDITAGTAINVGGGIIAGAVTAGTTVTAGNYISARSVTAGGDITAGSTSVQFVTSPTGVLRVAFGIHPSIFSTDPSFPAQGAKAPHVFTVDSIVSPNGIDFSGNQFGGIDGYSSGGLLTINARTITFDAEVALGNANFNGADAGAFGSGNPAEGGDGGTFIVNTTGNIVVSGADITATTGLNSASGVFSGAGGNVTLDSSGGSITVDQRIEVSSDDPNAPRQSASGGNITLHSDLTTGQGITVGQTASLLSLLDANAPGPGGSITLSTFGADINILGGTVEADRGMITISQLDPANQTPVINIDGATLTSEILSILGAGDVNIGVNSPVTLNAVTLSISATDNLNWSGGTLIATATNSDGNVSISAGQAINITNDLDIERTNGSRTSGLNVTLNAGTDLSVGGNLSVVTDISNLTAGGGNIAVSTGGNLTVGGSLSLETATNAQAGGGGNIDVNVGGALNAGNLFLGAEFAVQFPQGDGENVTLDVAKDLIVHNTANSGGIDLEIITPIHEVVSSGANLTFSVGGNLVTDPGGDTTLFVNNNINQIVTGANISGTVMGNLSTNNLNVELSNQGGEIGTGGNVGLDVSGGLTTQGNATFLLSNPSGTIVNGGDITASIGNSLTASSVTFTIDNSAGGHIGGSGNMSLTTVGDLTTSAGGVNFTLQNTGGAITNGGNITLAVGGNVSTQGLSLLLQNEDGTSAAGSIGTGGNLSATVGGNLSADFVDMFIGNRAGGMIGSGGNMTLAVNGALTTTGDAGFIIDTRFDSSINGSTVGSMIGSSVTLEVSAASVDIGGLLAGTFFNPGSPFSGITNRGSTINGDATYEWNVTGDMTIGGAADFELLNGEGNNVGVPLGGTIHGNALIQVVAGSLTGSGVVDPYSGGNVPAVFAHLDNKNSGVIDGNATINFNITGDINANNGASAPGDAAFLLQNQQNANGTAGGSIGGAATLTVSAAGISVAGDFDAEIDNQRGFNAPGPSGGSIGTDATLTVTATSLSVGGELDALINNQNNGSGSGAGGSIGGNAAINLTLSGDLTTTGSDSNSSGIAGDANFVILNANLVGGSGGSIGSDATIAISAANVSTSGSFDAEIQNTTGSIGGSASTNLNIAGNATVSGVLQMQIQNYDFSGNTPGQIGGAASISITTGGDLTAGSLIGLINNRSGGSIGSAANLIINVGGALTTSADITDPFGFSDSVFLVISNRFDNTQGNPAGASSINGGATLSVSADSVSIGGRLSTNISNSGSTLNGNALLEFGITNNMTVQGEADLMILNDADSASPSGGTMHGSATLQVSANDFTANALFAFIDSRRGGVIDSDATIAFNLTGNFSIPGTNPGNSDSDSTVPGEADLYIFNQKGTGTAGGTIGGNASITFSAANISTAGLLDPTIVNNNGTITGDATINVATRRDNFDGGSPGDLTADSLDVEILNGGGSVGGNETINMNVGGTASITNDATFAITGSDPTGSAAINFNGGDYQVGGNFRSTIDGSGTIAFNSTTVNANTLKVGVFGSNGTIMIGSGPLSATTLMKLYATGSSGTIDFTKSVTLTLTSQTAAIILAANTITIDQNVVVTIVGSFPASVYANIANYVGGTCGNACGSFGSFAGKGATTSALGGQPTFDDPPSSATSATKSTATGSTTVASATASSSTKSQSSSSTSVASSSRITGATRGTRQSPSQSDLSTLASAKTTTTAAVNTIKVADSGQLLSMLDSATPSSNGKIMITSSKGDGVSNNPSPSNPNRPNAASGLSHDRSAAVNQTSSKTSVALLDHTRSVR